MFVEWETLDRADWDRLVEALLYRMFSDTHRVQVYEGSGGDGGRDVVVVGSESTTTFQLKFFPGGYSGPFGSRRPQITKSFKAAMTQDPDEWVLVVPHKLKAGERTFNEKLRRFKTTSKPMDIREMGATELNGELAKYPDLRTAFERNELHRLMEIYNLESKVAPVTPADVEKRISGVQEALNAGDVNWRWAFSTVPGQEQRMLVAKHALAHEVSPVSVEVHTDISRAPAKTKKQIHDFFKYGLDGQIELAPDVVGRLEVKGPPIAAQVLERVAVTIQRARTVPVEFQPAVVTMLDASGRVTASHEGVVEHGGAGQGGTSLRMRFYNIFEVTLKHPNDPAARVETNIKCKLPGAALADVIDGCNLYLDLQQMSDVTFNLGHGIHRITLAAEPELTLGLADLNEVRKTRDFAEDLQIVQRKFRQCFPLPNSFLDRDRAMVRALRLLTEGKRTTLPDSNNFPISISPDQQGEVWLPRLLEGEPLPFWATSSEVQLPALGRLFRVENLTIGHQQMILDRYSEAALALAAGEEFDTYLRPVDGSFLSAVARGFTRGDEPVRLEPWKLIGVTEPGVPDFETPERLPPLDSPD